MELAREKGVNQATTYTTYNAKSKYDGKEVKKFKELKNMEKELS